MKINHYLSLLIFLAISEYTFAEITIPSFIANNMVLQRNTELKIWGWASNEKTVTVTFNGVSKHTNTNQNHQWIVTFPDRKSVV